MKNTGIIIVIIALIAVAAIIGVVLMQGYNTNKTPSPSKSGANNQIIYPPTSDNSDNSNNNPPSQPPPITSSPKTYQVSISNFAFSPSTLTIKKGDMITWTNKDSVSHTVTSDSGDELDSNMLSKGKTYSHTFNKAGTFNYHCTPHPSMKAKIIVE